MNKKVSLLLVIFMIIFGQAISSPESVFAEKEKNELEGINGLKGDYYVSSGKGKFDFHELKSTVVDGNIHYPDLDPILKSLTNQDNDVNVRWTGQIRPEYSEDYTFYMIGDNGFRLWVDNQLIIDHWVNDWDKEQKSNSLTLEAGKKYDIKIEYFEDTGGSNLFLRWSSASQAKAIVPPEALYLPLDFDFSGPSMSVVSEDGKTMELTFSEQLNAIPKGAINHIKVNVSGEDWPLESVSSADTESSVAVIQMSEPIFGRSANVRVIYDGEGGITTKDSNKLLKFNRFAINHSTFSIETPWTKDVSADNALPEYPRPQMVREKWKNLNGNWEFESATKEGALPTGETLAEEILVPYPVESKLSGIERYEERMWYKRQFSIPEDWGGERVLLHFGAVDWETTVYVNGEKVGSHRGGHTAFSFDITDDLKQGDNELIVHVYDPTDPNKQSLGKQRLNPGGIFYTSASGIWQTVWLEPVAKASIDKLDTVADIDGEVLNLTVQGTGVNNETVEAIAMKDGKEVGRASGKIGSEIQVPVPDPRLWSTEDPFLYDLKIILKDGSQTGDEVAGYFGMREITIGEEDGVLRPLLNGEFVFQMGPLDQGYWPDGIYTAPTDEALKFDIEEAQRLGFNMIRKHAKIEPARWYYWADKMGMLVWQDMPSMYSGNPSTETKQQFEYEFSEMLNQFNSFPSIVQWVVFNEGWGQYDTERLTKWVKEKDPNRIVNNASGWTDKGAGDVIDFHVYVGPGSPTPTSSRIAVLGEYGGLGLKVPQHWWGGGIFTYEMMDSSKALTDRYISLIDRIKQYKQNPGLSAAVYTQITDVEGELNGLLTYDRKVEKVDFELLQQAHKQLIGGLDASDLQKHIDSASALFEAAEVGDEPGKYPQEAVDDMRTAIALAKSVADDPNATRKEISQAIKALEEAVAQFKEQVHSPIPMDAEIDHFDNETIADSWSIINPVDSNWTLTEKESHLRIKTLPGDIYQEMNDMKNIFLRDVQSEDFEITAKVTAPIRENHQQAGLIIWQDDDNYVRFGHVWDTTTTTGYSLETAKEEKQKYSKANNMARHPGSDSVYMKFKKVGNEYTTYYWSGLKWEKAADPITASLDNVKVGLYATSTGSNKNINADFDYFTIKQDEALSSADMKTVVEKFEEEGEFTDDRVAHALKLHLTAVDRYEKQEAAAKVVKHMEGFKQLLEQQKENEWISMKAYSTLKANAEALIKKWQ
ncbi:FIMAH domain-containing protein [Bacillus sp. FSL K6-3431]|uniref:FIMAH domain-containing protein n=1 Tax=Bacillus sp. FSL K6-3431 TaxID=2921500 RepID=UPI0030FA4842